MQKQLLRLEEKLLYVEESLCLHSIALPHFFGCLASTDEGMEFLREWGVLKDYFAALRSPSTHPLLRRAIVWIFAHVACTRAGACVLDEFGLIPFLCSIAEEDPHLPLRGTAVLALSMMMGSDGPEAPVAVRLSRDLHDRWMDRTYPRLISAAVRGEQLPSWKHQKAGDGCEERQNGHVWQKSEWGDEYDEQKGQMFQEEWNNHCQQQQQQQQQQFAQSQMLALKSKLNMRQGKRERMTQFPAEFEEEIEIPIVPRLSTKHSSWCLPMNHSNGIAFPKNYRKLFRFKLHEIASTESVWANFDMSQMAQDPKDAVVRTFDLLYSLTRPAAQMLLVRPHFDPVFKDVSMYFVFNAVFSHYPFPLEIKHFILSKFKLNAAKAEEFEWCDAHRIGNIVYTRKDTEMKKKRMKDKFEVE